MRVMQGGSVLLDAHGNPIPPGEERQRAESELKNFMEKHKSRFEDFWRHHGFGARPPIKYDQSKREWFWVGE